MKFIKLFSVLFLVLFVSSCDIKPSNRPGVDGYKFEKETFKRTEFPVEIILFDNHKELEKEFLKRGGKVKQNSKNMIAAFAVIRYNDDKCTIYMVDPKVKYEPEFIGHELVHCIYGEWHY